MLAALNLFERKPTKAKIPDEAGILIVSLLETGAGEGIRTLDPNLGKVVLYP